MQFSEIENFLQDRIFPDLENGRPNFDKPHTIAVVQKVKDIITNNSGLRVDPLVLIIAAYAHDWGYSGLFKDGIITDYEKIKDVKAEHMKVGAQKVNNILNNKIFNDLSDIQKENIVHLVRVHDKLDLLKEADELILMEADTLGGLDLNFVKPTFDKESNDKWMAVQLQDRLNLFITDYSKQEAKKLIKLRKDYYEN